jgi:hypothetical protein
METEPILIWPFAVAPDVRAKVQVRLAPLTELGADFTSIYARGEDSIIKELA